MEKNSGKTHPRQKLFYAYVTGTAAVGENRGVVRRRRWWCKWSAAAMVVVGRDQTRHYYYNCCITTYCRRRRRRRRLHHRHPTTGKNPNLNCGGEKRGRRGRRLLVRVSAHAPARQNSVAGLPVALPRRRFLNLVGLYGASAAIAARFRADRLTRACWTARRMRGRVQYIARGRRTGTGYGRRWTDRSAVDEVQSSMVRGECGATGVSVCF